MLELAGAKNAFADRKEDYAQISREEMAKTPVDAYVVLPYAGSLEADEGKRYLIETFPGLQASTDQRVAFSAFEYLGPGWRLADTIEDLARQLHPDAFDTPSQTHQYSDTGARQ